MAESAFAKMNWINTLSCERRYPCVFGVIAFFLVLFFHISFGNKWLFSTTASTGAVLFGFSITSISILFALDSQAMRNIRRSKYICVLVSYLREGLFSSILIVLSNLLALAIDANSTLLTALWAGFLAYGLCCIWRLSHCILKLFANPGPEHTREEMLENMDKARAMLDEEKKALDEEEQRDKLKRKVAHGH